MAAAGGCTMVVPDQAIGQSCKRSYFLCPYVSFRFAVFFSLVVHVAGRLPFPCRFFCRGCCCFSFFSFLLVTCSRNVSFVVKIHGVERFVSERACFFVPEREGTGGRVCRRYWGWGGGVKSP